MSQGGLVRYRDRMVAGRKFNAFLVATAAFCVGYPLLMGVAVTETLVALPLLAVLWLLFGVLRTTVSDRTVNIKYALWGPEIPLASITTCRPIEYSWREFGGFGIRRGRGGWMYNMIGDGGNAVRIVWTDATGRERITYVGTRTAKELAAAINEARACLPESDSVRGLPRASDDEPGS